MGYYTNRYLRVELERRVSLRGFVGKGAGGQKEAPAAAMDIKYSGVCLNSCGYYCVCWLLGCQEGMKREPAAPGRSRGLALRKYCVLG